MTESSSLHPDGPCYRCGRPGVWMPCCNKFMCAAHRAAYGTRALDAGLDLAHRTLVRMGLRTG